MERRQLAGKRRDSGVNLPVSRRFSNAIAFVAGRLPALQPALQIMKSKAELLENWIDAFQKRDLERVVDCYADKAINFQVAAGEPSIGKTRIRTDNAEFFQAFPDAWSKAENILSDGDWAAWEWIGGGTFLGGFYGNKPTGRSFEIRGCGFFQFQNEKIILQRGYWDKISWFSQIGLDLNKE